MRAIHSNDFCSPAVVAIIANDLRSMNSENPVWNQMVSHSSQMTEGGTVLRAKALADLMVLDSPEEATFNDLVFVAAQACTAPIALITLLDTNRQWFKARFGLDVCETEIEHSVCRIDIDRADFLEIVDLTVDGRTKANPLVMGERHFRAYAGAPLVLRSGVVVGRLCVIHTAPRPEGLSEMEIAMLRSLARLASENLELRRGAKVSNRMVTLQTALVEIGETIRSSRDTEQMAFATAGIVGRVLSADRAGFASVDEAVETIEVQADWTAPGIVSIAGRHRLNAYGDLRESFAHGEPLIVWDALSNERTLLILQNSMRIGVRSLVDMPVRHNGKTIALFFVHSAHPRSWPAEEIAFLRSAADRLEAGVAQHRTEQQQRIINGEIAHRLKNTLTMVQAIARQTLGSIEDREAVDAFGQRLIALSSAHDALIETHWTQADLRTIATTVIDTIGFADRCTLDGPPLALGPRAAVSFSLIVHELLTNAFKYGSLSNDKGAVSLNWGIDTVKDEDLLVIQWRENGGPPVSGPARHGFGSKLLNIGLVGTGGVNLRYDRAGFSADLQASLRHLNQA
jgi:two-component sensor histidine kinase